MSERKKICDNSTTFETLLNEIESHITDAGIITFVNDFFKSAQIWDIHRKDKNKVIYGAEPKQWPLFYQTFFAYLVTSRNCAIILRSFLTKTDDVTKLPFKEIRGYIVQHNTNDIKFRQLNAREVAYASSTNANTNKPLTPEESIIYCGTNNERLNESFLPI